MNGPPPRNNRWVEDERDRSSGGGGARWQDRVGDRDDWTQPLPRNEVLEAELFSSSTNGGTSVQYDDIPVEATGDDVPTSINTFADIKLTEIIRMNITLARYERPTPVQVCVCVCIYLVVVLQGLGFTLVWPRLHIYTYPIFL
ncbi:ATP-dependent RNA helicase DDX3Y [Portunus trituberculatus]|uniref:ATP-dependent RNA helicase DDX3Y n=1 Tax=Portunus trituberculatus TaxID=210409 RepID=A0A5B7K1Y3_PORTR|nr:ATP-dependent RNA helicase DDX3Y [Portunus trituberculatus]